MARPIKAGLDYFPFDVDFFSDEKIVVIAGEYGLKGELTAIKLLCAVYRNGYFAEWSKPLKYKLLKDLPGVSQGLLEQIVQRLVDWDFFDKDLFNSAKILTSKGIQRRYQLICAKMHRKDSIVEYSLLPPPKQVGVAERKPRRSAGKKERKPDADDDHSENATASRHEKARSPEPERDIALSDSLAAMRMDAEWSEPVCTRYHITPDKLVSRLDEFAIHCRCNGKERHDDIGDAKRHFCQWLSKQKDNTPRPSATGDYTFNGGFGGKDT